MDVEYLSQPKFVNNESYTNNSATIFPYDDLEPYTPDAHEPEHSREMIRYYMVWVILAIGIPSNIIAIIVVSCSRRLRETPSGVLLLTLTVVDTVVLVSTRLVTLTVHRGLGDKWINVNQSCLTALYYVTYSGRCAASFIVASISINRFVVVVHPERSGWFKQARSALIQVAVAVGSALIVNTYVIIYPPLVNQYCEHCYFLGVLFVEILLTDIIVSIGIMILSAITIRGLIKSRPTLTDAERSDAVTEQRRRQATVLLVVVAVTYVMLRVQYKVVWVPVFVMEHLTGSGPGGIPSTLRNAYYITYCLFLLNHATNLYQYCLCLHEFRRQSCRLLCPTLLQKRFMRRASDHTDSYSSSGSQKIKATQATAL